MVPQAALLAHKVSAAGFDILHGWFSVVRRYGMAARHPHHQHVHDAPHPRPRHVIDDVLVQNRRTLPAARDPGCDGHRRRIPPWMLTGRDGGNHIRQGEAFLSWSWIRSGDWNTLSWKSSGNVMVQIIRWTSVVIGY
ncbi:unnamed protein product [Urochloa humidicola]